MWEVVNRTPLSAQGYFVRDNAGAEHWCLAVRGRFDVLPDGLVALAEAQESVRLAPSYTDDSAVELTAEADLAPFRPATDVLIAGEATAPDGMEFQSQAIRINVGGLSKSAVALGPRRIRKTKGQWRLVDRSPATGVPLSWRVSLGGTDPFAREQIKPVHEGNPIGRGWSLHFAGAPEGAEIELPQIENANAPVRPDHSPPDPVGFGPLQPAWQPRLAHAGTYDQLWQNKRAPLFPEDFSDAFHQAAPPDQVYPGYLRGGEPVAIEGLHPDGPYRFRLPQAILEARTWIGHGDTTHRFRIVSAMVDGTARTLDLTWNASLPCPEGDHLLKRSLITLPQMAGVAR